MRFVATYSDVLALGNPSTGWKENEYKSQLTNQPASNIERQMEWNGFEPNMKYVTDYFHKLEKHTPSLCVCSSACKNVNRRIPKFDLLNTNLAILHVSHFKESICSYLEYILILFIYLCGERLSFTHFLICILSMHLHNSDCVVELPIEMNLRFRKYKYLLNFPWSNEEKQSYKFALLFLYSSGTLYFNSGMCVWVCF